MAQAGVDVRDVLNRVAGIGSFGRARLCRAVIEESAYLSAIQTPLAPRELYELTPIFMIFSLAGGR